jgi:hypothetical protein
MDNCDVCDNPIIHGASVFDCLCGTAVCFSCWTKAGNICPVCGGAYDDDDDDDDDR